ncbi:MAG: DAK2 domain-containing protein, partial [Clostridiales bacterium]
GGKGILVIMEGGLSALLGQKITAQTDIKDSSEKKSAPADTFSLTEEIEFGYCTEFFILGKNIPVEKIKNYYTKNIPGDSLIVVGMEDFVKVHFHSNAPWKILEYASSFGDLNDIKIDNMRCQNQKLQAKEAQKAEETPQKTAQTSQEATKIQSVEEEKVKCGVLSVCAGDGMSEIFRKMGVKTLGGGQTMNPSAEEIINAINEMSADEIIILPNNSNIILTAKQAQKMVKKPIVVLESKFMTQGLGAMLNYDKNLSAKENAKEMKESMAVVQSAEITFAVRDSQYQDIEIKANDLLALQEGKIIFTGHDLQDTISLLLEKMMAEAEDPSIISLFYGHDVDEKQALAIAAHLESIYDELDIECLYGGQPLYYFLISLE